MSKETILKNDSYLAKLLKNMPKDIKNRSVVKHFPSNTIMLKKDSEVKYVYIIYSGTLRVINEFANGNIYGFAYIDSTDFVGALEILAEESKTACTVEAVTDCVALRISKEDFLEWFEKDIFFSTNIAKLLAKKLYPTIYRNGAVFMNSSIHSFIAFLIRFVQKDIQEGKTALINKKRQYIADELGISLRTVHRIIKKLKEDNLLTIIKGKIYVNKNQYERLIEIVDDFI
ncbi:Crp/Fnr family transcriptional regulator [Crassaminicella thermophila]|uniref:Crp/Fnr family transcriptional regulator n=1 Tax=Crassaminicella thermophila TaxID=2599308 RepID=A0A5C0SC36_CRATE|nr:Crp/Fnr family transcriptional regulator [Crassaminicella thermophila]QEK11256.1 Crp/Fnr family transcriptional regulator [Crassaminicella thermophila]